MCVYACDCVNMLLFMCVVSMYVSICIDVTVSNLPCIILNMLMMMMVVVMTMMMMMMMYHPKHAPAVAL